MSEPKQPVKPISDSIDPKLSMRTGKCYRLRQKQSVCVVTQGWLGHSLQITLRRSISLQQLLINPKQAQPFLTQWNALMSHQSGKYKSCGRYSVFKTHIALHTTGTQQTVPLEPSVTLRQQIIFYRSQTIRHATMNWKTKGNGLLSWGLVLEITGSQPLYALRYPTPHVYELLPLCAL